MARENNEEYETDEYKVRHFDDVTIVRLKNPNLTGMLDVTRLTDEFRAMIDNGIKKLVLDLKYVQFCGSAALGMFIGLHRKLAALGGRFVLSHPENIRELLDLSRMSSMFNIANDPKEALAMMK